jgi:hypothetical protein
MLRDSLRRFQAGANRLAKQPKDARRPPIHVQMDLIAQACIHRCVNQRSASGGRPETIAHSEICRSCPEAAMASLRDGRRSHLMLPLRRHPAADRRTAPAATRFRVAYRFGCHAPRQEPRERSVLMKPIWDFLERAVSVSPALAHGDVHGAARDVAIAKAAVSAQPRPQRAAHPMGLSAYNAGDNAGRLRWLATG